MGQFKIAEYYLDIQAIEALKTESQKALIHQYYNELLHGQCGPNSTISMFNTLIKSGYLKSLVQEERDEKITKVLS